MHTLTSDSDEAAEWPALQLEPPLRSEASLITFDTSQLPREVKGEKAAALELLGAQGLPVPAWFLVHPEAMLSGSRRGQSDEFLQLRDPVKIKYFAQRCILSARAEEEIAAGVNQLLWGQSDQVRDQDAHFAVRVSLPAEEAARRLTEVDPLLYLSADDVPAALLRLWQSIYGEEALLKRASAEQQLVMPPPALIVQRMVRADISGLAYGGDPLTGRRGVTVIAAVYGLGTSIVSGESDADTYEITREGIVSRRNIACKQIAHVLDLQEGRGVSERLIPASQQELPLLTDAQVAALSDLTWQAGELYSRPQELEWAMDAGHISLLGSRPAPALARLGDPDANRTHWRRETIDRHYPGVLTTLSYSLARLMVQERFQALARALNRQVASGEMHRVRTNPLVGHLDGMVYLNSDSVRSLLSQTSGADYQRENLVWRLGLGIETIDDSGAGGADACGTSRNVAFSAQEAAEIVHLDVLGSSRIFSALQAQASRQEVLHRNFTERMNRLLQSDNLLLPLGRCRVDELVERFQTIESDILKHWDAPAANQIVGATSRALLGQLTNAWCEDASGQLQDDLLRDASDLPGSAAAKTISQIAAGVADSKLVGTFLDKDASSIRKAICLDAYASVRMEIADYLDSWGDVVPGGFKIEAATLRENPLPLYRFVAAVAAGAGVDEAPRSLLPSACVTQADLQTARLARVRAGGYFSDRTMRRRYFNKVYALASVHASREEQYAFDLTKVFAALRALLIEIGKRLYAIDALASPMEVLHLELEEVIGYVEGTASCADLQSLATVRAQQYEAWARQHAERPVSERVTRVQPVLQRMRSRQTA